MKPRKTRNSYNIYIGNPSMGRIAVVPNMKEAHRVETYYKELHIPVRIVPSRRKEVVM